MVKVINDFFKSVFKKKNMLNPRPTRSTRKALKQADDMIKHPEKYKGYHNLDEMFNDILSED